MESTLRYVLGAQRRMSMHVRVTGARQRRRGVCRGDACNTVRRPGFTLLPASQQVGFHGEAEVYEQGSAVRNASVAEAQSGGNRDSDCDELC